MQNYIRVLLLLTALPAAAQNDLEQIVRKNFAFFEHMFTTLAATSGVHQQSYLGHIGLDNANAEVVLKIAAEFSQQEELLKQQALTALREQKSDMNPTLERIRSQRTQLLQQSAVRVLRGLDMPAFQRLVSHMQRIEAELPRRAK